MAGPVSSALMRMISLETKLSSNTNLKQQRQVKVRVKSERKTNHLSYTETSASFS